MLIILLNHSVIRMRPVNGRVNSGVNGFNPQLPHMIITTILNYLHILQKAVTGFLPHRCRTDISAIMRFFTASTMGYLGKKIYSCLDCWLIMISPATRLHLNGARLLADHLLSQVGPGKVNIVKTGNYRGMPSSSILEPMVFLYRRTGDNRYLDFAKYIVDQWETNRWPKLISSALPAFLFPKDFLIPAPGGHMKTDRKPMK